MEPHGQTVGPGFQYRVTIIGLTPSNCHPGNLPRLPGLGIHPEIVQKQGANHLLLELVINSKYSSVEHCLSSQVSGSILNYLIHMHSIVYHRGSKAYV